MEFLITGNDTQQRVSIGMLWVLYQGLSVVMHGTGQITVRRQQVAHKEMRFRLQHFSSFKSGIMTTFVACHLYKFLHTPNLLKLSILFIIIRFISDTHHVYSLKPSSRILPHTIK